MKRLSVAESRSYSRDLHSVRRVRLSLSERGLCPIVSQQRPFGYRDIRLILNQRHRPIAAIDRSALSSRACVFRVFSLAECELLQSFSSLFRRRRSDSEMTQNGCEILTRGTKLAKRAFEGSS